MIAQVYVKSTEDITSIIVADNDKIYFHDVIDVPEITGIQRGVSFVKHNLNVDSTEIFTDKLNVDDVLNDAYIRYCKVNAIKGIERNEQADNRCATELQAFLRWNFVKRENER